MTITITDFWLGAMAGFAAAWVAVRILERLVPDPDAKELNRSTKR